MRNGGRAASWVPVVSAEDSAALDQDVAVVVAGLGMVTVSVGAFVRRAVAARGLDVVQEWSWRSERRLCRWRRLKRWQGKREGDAEEGGGGVWRRGRGGAGRA